MARFRHYVTRLTAFGDCYGGDEEWSTGFYFGEAAADVGDPTQSSADAFLANWLTIWNDAGSGISSEYRTKGVRIAKLDKDTGKVLPAYNFYAYPPVPDNAGGPFSFPHPQLSLVASLQARPDAGLGAKGRMFLPGVAYPISTSGKITSVAAQDICDNLALMFNNLNADAGVPGNLINASRGRALQIGNDMPVNRYVQDVLVGDVYDTQRRRRNQLNESYVTAEVTL